MSRPQHPKAVRLRLTSAALGLGALVSVAGCSAGQVTETDTQVPAVNGGTGKAGGIAVRDAQLTFPTGQTSYPAGSSAPLQTVLTNADSNADRLVQVSSPYAGSAQLGGNTTLAGQTSLRALGQSAGAAGAQAPQSAPAQPAAGPEQSAGTSQQSAQVPRQQVTQITLRGITQEIHPGQTIPVTFVFEKAGPITAQVPIAADTAPRPEHGTP